MTFIIGFSSGLFGGLVGLGGGVIMIPLMVGALKLDQHKAHGTSRWLLSSRASPARSPMA